MGELLSGLQSYKYCGGHSASALGDRLGRNRVWSRPYVAKKRSILGLTGKASRRVRNILLGQAYFDRIERLWSCSDRGVKTLRCSLSLILDIERHSTV
jgi:hypothetical protein